GIGISAEEQGKLFKSFSQVDGSHSRKYGGTGLGLVISKELIEMMGGTIWVVSEKGKGSVFNLELSFEVSDKINEEINTANISKLDRTESKAKILLVEDDSINQIVVSRMLKEMQYSFDFVSNGIEAISILKEKDFDLCLMDIQMPGMDGIETTSIIRSNEMGTNRHLPIIALTAHALLGDREKFISLGMDDYIAKPFQIPKLYNIIENLLSKYRNDSNSDILNKLIQGKNIMTNDIDTCKYILIDDIKLVMLKIQEKIIKLQKLSRIEEVVAVEKLSHEIKELSAKINANQVRTLAFRVELAARRGNFSGACDLIKELNVVFQNLFSNVKNIKDGGSYQ
ncbi:MAG: response regulator, partial [Ruminiclostridium sp.]